MSDAIEMRPAYFRGKHPIEAYGAGGFRFADLSHKGGLLCAPSGFYEVDLSAAPLKLEHLTQVLELRNEINFLILGLGKEVYAISRDVQKCLSEHNIGFDIMNTGAAVRTYNILLAENREVAALLYPV